MALTKLFSVILISLLFTTAKPHRTKPRPNRLKPDQLSHLKRSTEPTEFFEVTKPVDLPDTEPCSHRILTNQDFAFTYGKPPVTADYNPPKHCREKGEVFSKIVLEWRATCKGTQFDRIFGVWLAGVELLRSCTAEPTSSGIVWTVQKDVTRYHSLFVKNQTQTLAVFLGNVVDGTYTGVYYVNLTLHFYPYEPSASDRESSLGNLGFGFGSWADSVLPISRNLPLNDGLWFEISDSVKTQTKEFKIPRNTYRAVLEVYVSFHENDEFWYANLPNEYISETGATDQPGNGPFREVLVSLDGGAVVGAVWPFPVIYTGGFNPLLWRPITGIGSFDLPSYDIEITPFLGKILDGKTHTFGFNVTNALNVWFVNANLHLWLDKHGSRTEGKLLKHVAPGLALSQDYEFQGLDGKFLTSASRRVLSVGWVKSSLGSIVIRSIQDLSFSNLIVLENDGISQTVSQIVRFDDSVRVETPLLGALSAKSEKSFPFFLSTGYTEPPSGDVYVSVTSFSTGFNEDRSLRVDGIEFPKSSLKNAQSGLGYMVVENSLVTSGSGSTQQVYDYKNGNISCYFRNISSSDYKIVYDKTRNSCRENDLIAMEFAPSDDLGFSSA